MFDWLTAPIAGAIGSGLGFLGQQDTNASQQDIANSANASSAQQAQINRDFQERLSNTAYQRQVQDMSSAGLNPMLAYMKGGGASTPSGSQANVIAPQYTSPITGAAQYKLTSAQAAKTEAEVPQVFKQTEKIAQEINNLKTENDKANALITNIKQEYQNLMKVNHNLTDVGNQIRKSIELMSSQIQNFGALTSSISYQAQINNFEAQLRQFDVEAAKGAGNFGREYNQFKPLIDILRSFIRR